MQNTPEAPREPQIIEMPEQEIVAQRPTTAEQADQVVDQDSTSANSATDDAIARIAEIQLTAGNPDDFRQAMNAIASRYNPQSVDTTVASATVTPAEQVVTPAIPRVRSRRPQPAPAPTVAEGPQQITADQLRPYEEAVNSLSLTLGINLLLDTATPDQLTDFLIKLQETQDFEQTGTLDQATLAFLEGYNIQTEEPTQVATNSPTPEPEPVVDTTPTEPTSDARVRRERRATEPSNTPFVAPRPGRISSSNIVDRSRISTINPDIT